MENGRTSKDVDIARMSALKTAVDIVAAFHESVVDAQTAADLAMAVADKLVGWILRSPSVMEPVQPVPKEKPKTPEQRIAEVKTEIKANSSLYKPLSEVETKQLKGGKYVDMGWSRFPDGVFPLSAKQFGFICKLYRDVGIESDPVFIHGLSSKGASTLIDALVEMTNGE